MTFKGHICTHIYTEVAEHDSPNSQLPQAEHSHTLSPQQAPADPKDPPRAATEICRGKLPVEAGTVQGFSLKNKKIPYPFSPQLEPSRAARASCPVGPARHTCPSAWSQPLHGSLHVLICGALGETRIACLRQTEHLLRGQPSKQPTNALGCHIQCEGKMSETVGAGLLLEILGTGFV